MAASTETLKANYRDGIVKAAGFRLSDNDERTTTAYAEHMTGTGAPSGRYGRDATAALIYWRDDSSTLADAIYYLAPSGSTWRTLTSDLILPAASELTISGGAITATQSFHTVDTEADAASDDLDTIDGLAAGEVCYLYPANGARTVVVKHGTDNIVCPGGRDISLDDASDYLIAIGDGTNVMVLAAPQLFADLASTANGYGASMIGVEDAAGNFAATDVEAALAEIIADFAAVTTGNGASKIGVEDAAGYYTATDAEAAIAEVGAFCYGLDPRNSVRLFDDFLSQLTEAASPWVLNKGSDGSAADPAVTDAEGGVVVLTSGADAGGTVAANGSQIVGYAPWQADTGGLVAEFLVHLNTAITDRQIFVGLTDSKSLEMPFTIDGSDVVTAVADDAVGLMYDSTALTDEWFAAAVDGTTQDAANGATGTAPAADTDQRITITVSADGATIVIAIDGTTVATLSGDAGVSPDVDLYPTVCLNSLAAASITADVDFVHVVSRRP